MTSRSPADRLAALDHHLVLVGAAHPGPGGQAEAGQDAGQVAGGALLGAPISRWGAGRGVETEPRPRNAPLAKQAAALPAPDQAAGNPGEAGRPAPSRTPLSVSTCSTRSARTSS